MSAEVPTPEQEPRYQSLDYYGAKLCVLCQQQLLTSQHMTSGNILALSKENYSGHT